MKFPVLKDKPVWPSKALCPWCNKNKVMEPHSMAIITGGAMRVVDPKNKSATIPDDCIGFLDLVWHGAPNGASGIDREICVRVPIADGTPGGQFEFYFCSTRCLREFLNTCVDQLEQRVAAGPPVLLTFLLVTRETKSISCSVKCGARF